MNTRSTQDEILFLEGAIKHTEKMAANMLAEYGNGVRPSWVSADLADYGDRISRYKAEIARHSMDNALRRAVADAATFGPVTSAAVHNVSLTELYAIINQTKGKNK